MKAEILKSTKETLLECKFINKIYTSIEIINSKDNIDPYIQYYRNSYDSERSPDLYILSQPFYSIYKDIQAFHGSPYDYDTHIPLFIKNIDGLKHIEEDKFESYKLAPLIANELGIKTFK